MAWVRKFRFHTGSIRSRYLHVDCSLRGSRFDSILVRLEGLSRSQYTQGGLGFDSILVRLEGSACRAERKPTHVSIPYWFD